MALDGNAFSAENKARRTLLVEKKGDLMRLRNLVSPLFFYLFLSSPHKSLYIYINKETMETQNTFKLFQDSKKFMTNEQFEAEIGTGEAYGEVGVFTYLNTSLHIIINNNGFELVLGNGVYKSTDLTELEKIFWDDFVQYEYPHINKN